MNADIQRAVTAAAQARRYLIDATLSLVQAIEKAREAHGALTVAVYAPVKASLLSKAPANATHGDYRLLQAFTSLEKALSGWAGVQPVVAGLVERAFDGVTKPNPATVLAEQEQAIAEGHATLPAMYEQITRHEAELAEELAELAKEQARLAPGREMLAMIKELKASAAAAANMPADVRAAINATELK